MSNTPKASLYRIYYRAGKETEALANKAEFDDACAWFANNTPYDLEIRSDFDFGGCVAITLVVDDGDPD